MLLTALAMQCSCTRGDQGKTETAGCCEKHLIQMRRQIAQSLLRMGSWASPELPQLQFVVAESSIVALPWLPVARMTLCLSAVHALDDRATPAGPAKVIPPSVRYSGIAQMAQN